MKRATEVVNEEHVKVLTDYISSTTGLKYKVMDCDFFEVQQLADQKIIKFDISTVSEVLSRTDAEGHPFVQVNFQGGKKVLLTNSLIGFKPAPIIGLDLDKLPKVVTTPDLISVFEAIEDATVSSQQNEELDMLKKVFNSIVAGGEHIGFDLTQERHWLWCFMHAKATA